MRYPVVAGSFYPESERELRDQLSSFKSKALDSIGVVSPHAGYMYSGATAAKACHALGQADAYVLIGPNHRCHGSPVGLSGEDWQTPLGDIELDAVLSKAIAGKGMARTDERCHEEEHSIEVQLPFLQAFYKNFKIVPISMMSPPIIPAEDFPALCQELGEAIAAAIKSSGKKVKLVASSDFSHYIPKDKAKANDMDAVESIKALDADGFLDKVLSNDYSVCGFGPIATAIHAVKQLGAKKAELLAYTSSGEITGEEDAVVGYAAIRFA